MTALNQKDLDKLKSCIPLNKLSPERFSEIAADIRPENYKAGEELFEQGDETKEFIYLINGAVGLYAGEMELEIITSGSDASRFAIAHQIPRRVRGVATSQARLIRLPTHLLDQGGSEKKVSTYLVEESVDDSGDWMTTMLQSPVFQRLPAANLQKVMMQMEAVTFEAGGIVVKQGDIADYYYIIEKGDCDIIRQSSDTARPIKLAELHSCDSFGEDALLSGAPRNVTVKMQGKGQLLRLSKDNFIKLVKEPVLQYIDYKKAHQEISEGAAWLDVRDADAFEENHIEGSVNIPFFSLRMKVSSLRHDQQQILVCDKGRTSEAAAFLLLRFGFNALILKDGIDAVSNVSPISEPPVKTVEEKVDRPVSTEEGAEQALLEQAKQEINKLESLYAESKASLRKLTLETDGLVLEAKDYQDKFEELQQSHHSKNDSEKDLQKTVTELSNKLGLVSEDYELAQTQLQKSIENEQGLNSAIKQNQQLLEDAKVEAANAIRELEKKDIELQENNSEQLKLQQELSSSNESLLQQELKNKELTQSTGENLSDIVGQLETYKKETVDLEQAYQTISNELDQANVVKENLLKEQSELQESIASSLLVSEGKNEKYQEDLGKLGSDLELANSELINGQSHIASLKEDVAELEKELGLTQEKALDQSSVYKEDSQLSVDKIAALQEKKEKQSIKLKELDSEIIELKSAAREQGKKLNDNDDALKILKKENDERLLVEEALNEKIIGLEAAISVATEDQQIVVNELESVREDSKALELLQEKHHELQAELDQKVAQELALESKLESFGESQASSEEEIEQLNVSLTEQQAEIAGLRSEKTLLEELQLENEGSNKALDSKIITLEKELSSSRGERQVVVGELESVREDSKALELLQGKHHELQAELDQRAAQELALENELESLGVSQASAEEEIEQLNVSLTEQQAEIAGLRSEKTLLEELQLENEGSNKALDSKIITLEKELSSSRGERQVVVGELESVREDSKALELLQGKHHELQAELDQRAAQELALENELESLGVSQASAEEEIEQLNTSLTEYQAEIAGLRSEKTLLEELQLENEGSNKALDLKIIALEKELSSSRGEQQVVVGELESVREDSKALEHLQEKHHELQAELDQKVTQELALKNKLESLGVSQASAEGELEQLNISLTGYQAEMAELRSEKALLEEQQLENEGSNKDLDVKVSALEKELLLSVEALQSKAEELDVELVRSKEMQSGYSKLQTDYKQQSAQNNRLTKDLEDVRLGHLSEKGAAENEFGKLETNLSGKTAELEKLKLELGLSGEKFEAIDNEKRHLEEKLSSLEQEFSSSLSSQEIEVSKIAKLEGELTVKDAELVEFKSLVDSSISQQSSLEAGNVKLEQAIEEREEIAERLTVDKLALEEKLSEAKLLIVNLEQIGDSSKAASSTDQDAIESLKKERDTLSFSLEDAKKEAALLAQNIEQSDLQVEEKGRLLADALEAEKLAKSAAGEKEITLQAELSEALAGNNLLQNKLEEAHVELSDAVTKSSLAIETSADLEKQQRVLTLSLESLGRERDGLIERVIEADKKLLNTDNEALSKEVAAENKTLHESIKKLTLELEQKKDQSTLEREMVGLRAELDEANARLMDFDIKQGIDDEVVKKAVQEKEAVQVQEVEVLKSELLLVREQTEADVIAMKSELEKGKKINLLLQKKLLALQGQVASNQAQVDSNQGKAEQKKSWWK